MALIRAGIRQTAGLVLGLLIGAALIAGGFVLAMTAMDVGATHDDSGNVHACVNSRSGQTRVTLPGEAPDCKGNEVLVELGGAAAIAELEARVAELEGDNVTQRQQIIALQEENLEQQNEIIVLQNENGTQRQQIVTLQEENIEQADDITELQGQNDTQREQIIDLQAKSIEQDQRLDALEDQNDEQNQQIIALQIKNAIQDEQIAVLFGLVAE